MKRFEIYWNDLTDEAKERLAELEHDNIDLYPIATIELEDINIEEDDIDIKDSELAKDVIISDTDYDFLDDLESDMKHKLNIE